MATRPSERKLEAYHLHGHIGTKALPSYRALFERIAEVSIAERIIEKKTHLVSLSNCLEAEDGKFHLIAHEGEPGLRPLILNLSNLSERSTKLQDSELLTTRTHCVVDPAHRTAAIEYNQRGVKANDLSNLISVLGRRFLNDGLTFEFTPIIRSTFWDDVERLGRIRLASVTMVKPNMAWSDDAQALISGLDESDAQRVSIEVSARPDSSLSKRRGVIGRLASLIRQGVTSIKQAKVVGRGDEGGDVTVKLQNHIENRVVQVARDRAGHPNSQQVDEALMRFVSELKPPSRQA